MSQNYKQDMARAMYMKNIYTQQQIAEMVGVSINTITRWIKDGNWKQIKASQVLGKSATLQRLYEQINEIQEAVQSRPKGERYVNTKEADILIKLTTSIEKLEAETPLHIIIDVFMDATTWLTKNEHKRKVLEFVELADKYIQSRSVEIED